MSNASGVIHGGLVIFVAGVAGLAIDWIDSHESQLRQFVASLDPNLTTMEFAGLCVVVGLVLVVIGITIDHHYEQRGDS